MLAMHLFMARILGIDYGTTKIGLALSDEEERFAFPYAIIPAGENAVRRVAALIVEEGVETVVVGASRDLRGEDNPLMAHARRFVQALRQEAPQVTVVWEDEAFTTQMARRAHARPEKTRKPPHCRPLDHSAAALILESYLERRHKE